MVEIKPSMAETKIVNLEKRIILEIVPTDGDTIIASLTILEATGLLNRLANLLEYHLTYCK